jgi:hypothetical protein
MGGFSIIRTKAACDDPGAAEGRPIMSWRSKENIRIEATRVIKDQSATELRYYLSNLSLDATRDAGRPAPAGKSKTLSAACQM